MTTRRTALVTGASRGIGPAVEGFDLTVSACSRDTFAGLVAGVTRPSRWAVVPNIPVVRPGPNLWRA